jgi:hypothetical protein
MISMIKRFVSLIKVLLQTNPRLYRFFQTIYYMFPGNALRSIDGLLLEMQALERNSWLSPELKQPILDNLLYLTFAPPGHYYSTIPDYKSIQSHKDTIFSEIPHSLPEIGINDVKMLDLANSFEHYYSEFLFPDQKTASFRFYLDNGVYSRGDAVVLYSMLRHYRPRQVIEVGSGSSTCLILDVNDRFLNHETGFISIDPDADRLRSMLMPGDEQKFTLVEKTLQEIDPGIFYELDENDIAFFDSTHVSKCNSDVNLIFFDILPRLKPGVLVHFHDIFYPFEYPEHWLLEIGAAWNEAYQLRAFLAYNSEFEIKFFSDYLGRFHKLELQKSIPAFLDGIGSSIWIQKR